MSPFVPAEERALVANLFCCWLQPIQGIPSLFDSPIFRSHHLIGDCRIGASLQLSEMRVCTFCFAARKSRLDSA